MYQKYLIPLVGLITATGSFAGQIQIGGVNGLTAAYVGSNIGGVQGSTGNWSERGYQNAMFNNTTVSSPTCTGGAGSTTCSIPTTDSVVAGTAGVVNQMTDTNLGLTYNLIEDGTGTGGHVNNTWASVNGAGTMIVPIDISDVDYAGIVINDFWGFSGANPTITFNFANAGAVAVVLPDSTTGPIRSSTYCTSATGTITCPGTVTGHGNILSGAPDTSVVTSTDSGITVSASTLWSGSYATNSSTVVGPYYNSSSSSAGQLMLDDLKFNLGSYSTDTLLSISFATNSVATGNNVSRLGVSAITVDQLATPEPSTILMVLSGFGLLAFVNRRRSLRA